MRRKPPRSRARQTQMILIGTLGASALTALVVGVVVYVLFSGDERPADRWYAESEFIRAVHLLELAELQTIETVERREKAETDLLLFSKIVEWLDSEATLMIRFQVLYTYVVDLHGEWRFDQRGDDLSVIAPALIAKIPAIDTATIERFSSGGWLPGKEEKLLALQESLTAVATERAGTKINLVLESSRQTLEDFLRQWAVREGHELGRIKIQFANELEPEPTQG